MNKCHTPLNWQNDTTPAINDTNLNYMDGCIETIDDRVVAMDTSKLEAEDIENVIANVTMDDETGIFTFTKYDGSTFTIDTKLEKIAVNFRYDTATQKLIITLDDGTTQEVDLSSLIHETDFADSSTIVWTVTNHVATASVKANSIGDAQMQTGYLTDAQNAKNGAELAATSANASRLESEGWAVGKQDGVDVPSTSPYYHNNAKYFAEYAGGNALSALTDVQISEAEDGQALLYNGTLNKWVNGAGTQFATLPVSNLSAVAGDSQVTLSWTNPEDVVVGGTTVAELEMIKVYRDNVLIERALMSTFTDTGLVNGQTYTYKVVAETTKGVESAVATISATPHGGSGLTLTLEGAKNDVITIKDSNGDTVGTCTFASGATTGTVTIDNFVAGNYTFTSSVAKDTASGTSDYTKSVALTNATTSVKVMPDGAISWYDNNDCASTRLIADSHVGEYAAVTPATSSYNNKLKVALSHSAMCAGTLLSNDSIDVSGKILKVRCKATSTDIYGTVQVGIATEITSTTFHRNWGDVATLFTGTSGFDGLFKSVMPDGLVGKPYLYILNGSQYGSNTTTLTIDAWWLEEPTTITLTLEGAKEDNITVKDSNGTTVSTCIFGSGQTSGTVTLDIIDGDAYTFESSVAKDTTSGTSNYTKTVNVSKDTTNVKVMPDSCLMWYGNSSRVTVTSSVTLVDSASKSTYKRIQGNVGDLRTLNSVDVTTYSAFKIMYNNLQFGTSPVDYQWTNALSVQVGSTESWKTLIRDSNKHVIDFDISSMSGEKMAYLTLQDPSYAMRWASIDILAMWFE